MGAERHAEDPPMLSSCGVPGSAQDRVSQSRIRPESWPVASIRPSGLKAAVSMRRAG